MYLKRVDGSSVRGDNIFVIREMEISDSAGFNSIGEGIRAGFSRFSVSDFPPHFRGIFSL